MDFSQAAFEAIEEWVQINQNQHSGFKWLNKKPDADWGFNANSWSPEIDKIRRRFEAKIGFSISFPPRERRKTVSFFMSLNQFILARKAETSRNSSMTALQQVSG